jgi:hypothetical protein
VLTRTSLRTAGPVSNGSIAQRGMGNRIGNREDARPVCRRAGCSGVSVDAGRWPN